MSHTDEIHHEHQIYLMRRDNLYVAWVLAPDGERINLLQPHADKASCIEAARASIDARIEEAITGL